ncbi:MAG TPA: metal ABC transporter substrate-binding protein [Candidatus Atribacteria bacterium]|nr:metal ABC transporter substrate-binding protein [Candidatus Atribacteria bacterium]HPZ40374.1 metal ABC transporter substrate-binding protein [Candidatus Atribacteria bacterium]HQD33798.1 metal ABC transporter substrate-binding protein [Candidatus Atribacteria bacterium]
MKKCLRVVLGVLILVSGFSSFSWGEKLSIGVSIAPLCSLVQEVGKDKVEIFQLIPNGADPHTYEPRPSDVRKIEEGQAFFLVGLGLDFFLEEIIKNVAEGKPIFYLYQGINLIKEGEGANPHIWLSLPNAQIMVKNISQALSTLDPENSAYYERNAGEYIQKLAELDHWFREKVQNLRQRSFVAQHPAWDYLARDYNLELKGVIEKSPGKEPSPRELKNLIEEMRKEDIRVIFAEPQLNQKIAQVLAQETNAQVVLLDPLGYFPEKPYFELMRENLNKILEAMK